MRSLWTTSRRTPSSTPSGPPRTSDPTPPLTRPRLFYAITQGIRVTVRPRPSPEHSDPAEPRFVFIYHIRIENVGARTAQLLRRHWVITDDSEGVTEIEGDGVIGQQPVLAPGDVHEYESFCVLRGTSGAMEGDYTFRAADGTAFLVTIPRFELRG